MRHPRLAPAALLLLLLGVGGCIDFVEPDVLELMRPVRLSVQMELSNRPSEGAGCGVGVPQEALQAPVSPAVLCLRAVLDPGRDRLGAARAVPQPTLRLLGTVIEPSPGPGGTLSYLGGVALPADALADTLIRLGLPEVEGVPLLPGGIRWVAVEQLTPDTIRHRTGEALQVRVGLPQAASEPRPVSQFWDFAVLGDTAALSVRSSVSGLPLASLRVPPELLDELGGRLRGASLRFVQRLAVQSETLLLDVALTQRIAWAVVRVEPDSARQ